VIPNRVITDRLLQEYHTKCKESHAVIIAQIPWASAGAARSQETREGTPGMPDVTDEEKLLTALLNANQDLIDVFGLYDGLEAATNVEEEWEKRMLDLTERTTHATVRSFRSWCGYPFDISAIVPGCLPRRHANP